MRIIAIDDDFEILGFFNDVLSLRFPDAEIILHDDHRVFLNDPRLYYADLYIIDIILNDIDGRALYDMLPPECRMTPALYVSGLGDTSVGESASFKDLITKHPYVEFIQKPISLGLFKNRVEMLLRASGRLLDENRKDVWRQMIEQDRHRINTLRKTCGLKPLSDLMVCGKPMQVTDG